MLVRASRSQSQFPSREITASSVFILDASAVNQKNLLSEEPYDLVKDVRNPLWFPRFAPVDAKTALDVIFKNRAGKSSSALVRYRCRPVHQCKMSGANHRRAPKLLRLY